MNAFNVVSHQALLDGENHHLEQSIDDFNVFVADSEATCVQDILDAPPRQRYLSSKIDDHQFKILFDLSPSPANHARLLSVSSLPPSPCFSLAFSHANSPA